MVSLLKRTASASVAPEPVRLELSGPVLSEALKSLLAGAEEHGGIERYAEALSLKSLMFRDALAGGRAQHMDIGAFMGLCTFMATVRRRIAPYLDGNGFARIKGAILDLLDGAEDTTTTDERWRRFCAAFPADKKHRWVRDLAAEILHNTDPERYPLMCRWVWDARANTGVIREIWHGPDVDHMTIPVPDGYDTFVALRQELAEYLTQNGVFKDVMHYVDLLSAQVYAGYIAAQGGSYLKADFTSEVDPMEHTRRILGLDGVKAGSARTRLRSIDGEAFVLDDVKLLD